MSPIIKSVRRSILPTENVGMTLTPSRTEKSMHDINPSELMDIVEPAQEELPEQSASQIAQDNIENEEISHPQLPTEVEPTSVGFKKMHNQSVDENSESSESSQKRRRRKNLKVFDNENEKQIYIDPEFDVQAHTRVK